MEDNEKNEARGDVCGLCQEPLAEGETVVQVVEDRHPTYDKEIVLHTYHKACCDNRETVTQLLEAAPDLYVASLKALEWFRKARLGTLEQLEEALGQEAPIEILSLAVHKARATGPDST